jgi:hypothetical protein
LIRGVKSRSRTEKELGDRFSRTIELRNKERIEKESEEKHREV